MTVLPQEHWHCHTAFPFLAVPARLSTVNRPNCSPERSFTRIVFPSLLLCLYSKGGTADQFSAIFAILTKIAETPALYTRKCSAPQALRSIVASTTRHQKAHPSCTSSVREAWTFRHTLITDLACAYDQLALIGKVTKRLTVPNLQHFDHRSSAVSYSA